MMNTNRNSGTKKATEATSSSMNPPLSAQEREEGRQGGRLRVGSGGNTPNNHTSNTRTPSSSSLSSPVTPSTGIVTENGSCQNALMTMASPPPPAEVTAAAAKAPSPSIPDPQDECVLCCYPFPLELDGSVYHECCGELICRGCIIAQKRTLIIGTNVKKPIKGSTEEELEFKTILCSKLRVVCPFCRAKGPTNQKEFLKRIWERIDFHKDPNAMNLMGHYYLKGERGLSKNLKRAKELFKRSYGLGDPTAANNLAELYSEHIPDQALMMKYLEEGARRGHAHCMARLAIRAAQSGDKEEAKRCFMTAARSGHVGAMGSLMATYREDSGNLVPKDDLATTLRAHKTIHDAGKSEPREYAMRYEVFRAKMITTRPRNAIGNVVLL